MAGYRWLQDGYVNGTYYHAGDIMQTADDWVPSGALDPLDAAAITAFFNAGPQPAPLARAQWSTQFVAAPAVYWRCVDPSANTYQLTGAGAALGPKIAMGMSLP
jgi:hypothetical protein